MRSAHMLASSLLAASVAATQSSGEELSTRERVEMVAKMATSFATFAGGDENAVALIESLREGVAVNLSFPAARPQDLPSVIPIAPPTGPMDWSDVRMALMLARDALMANGVLRPNGEQLQAALLGGEVAVPGDRLVRFRGVLQMRAEGFNWGRVASERFQRRPVVRIE